MTWRGNKTNCNSKRNEISLTVQTEELLDVTNTFERAFCIEETKKNKQGAKL